ncbi:hypothetical protein ACSDGV_18580 [Pseudomonas aeruginosa]|uniref:Uncharacterized protein n=1 Tax=Pseudomonas fluorescens TaxID=294 RepID=A0A448BKA9_PSEFL|nr:hypothetical protein [Pseudomonas aeruginosa]SSU22483.1 Uncharacterised protein [Acinetobacter baumannii]VEE45708.1 Uncharacterised protein [Pseudomonas fluorescens]AXS87440.1 hypothetical protein D0Y56_10895 [Pseudomonas aeruginosa]EKW2387215.1 hypothetical protein [Pseudomonas aeruginosa]ELP1386038.1 hypothetical protein [Pseudomonas aeruginosa]
MHTQNMRLWDQVQATDPSATKSAKVDGQQITSISGQHMIMKATQMFGPVGIGWGWTVIEERFDQGGPIFREITDAEGKKVSELIGHEVGHTVRIKLWFELDGKRGEVEQYGCTPFSYRSKWGITTDTEAPKKSLTDAVKKSLAMLGFSADIFLGLFDDRDYVEARREEEQIAKAEDQQAAEEQAKEERLAYIKSIIETMQGAQSQYELKKIHDVAVRKLTARKDDSGVKRIAREFSEQIKRFTEEKAA